MGNKAMQRILSGSVSLHVRAHGPADAPVILFSNSLGTDLRVWDLLLEHLAGEYRVVRYDNRGHGLSDCPDAPYTIGQLVDDAIAIIQALQLKDVNFVGLSIGGLIGQGLAARRPELLRSLVLMDTAAKIGTPAIWQERISTLRNDGLLSMADLILDRWFGEPYRTEGEYLPLMRNMLTRTPVEGYAGCCQAIAGADFHESTADLQLPVLAMAGEQDLATPPTIVEQTAALCGAEFHMISGAGHLPCVDQPAATAALINGFLTRVFS